MVPVLRVSALSSNPGPDLHDAKTEKEREHADQWIGGGGMLRRKKAVSNLPARLILFSNLLKK